MKKNKTPKFGITRSLHGCVVLNTLYLLCFLAGTTYGLVAWVLAKFFSVDLDATLHPFSSIGFFRLPVIAIALMFFGGFGTMFSGQALDALTSPDWLRLPLALLLALIAGFLLYQLKYAKHPSHDEPSVPDNPTQEGDSIHE